ncbi:MAG: NAD-dependent epimerase/dehydratase family protein [Candidatus Brocadiales bacterium]
MYKKILITGGAGFIGSHLAGKLARKGHEVTIFDNLDPQVHCNESADLMEDCTNKGVGFIHGDVRDYDMLARAVKGQEWIFHLAAAVGVGQAQYEIKHYVDVNVGGTANLLDILVKKKNKTKKLMVASSMSIYGEGPRRHGNPIPVPEGASPEVNSIYGLTKKAQEDMCLNFGRTYNFPTVALRYFNIYGPGQSLSNPYTGVIAIFLSRLKNNEAPVIYEDGLQTRDFISVHDIVDATILATERDEANYQVFNVGTGKPQTILKVAETLARLLEKDIKPKITHKHRKGDVRHCYADIKEIKNSLGWKPHIDLEQGLKEVVEWSNSQKAEDKFNIATKELMEKGLI